MMTWRSANIVFDLECFFLSEDVLGSVVTLFLAQSRWRSLKTIGKSKITVHSSDDDDDATHHCL